MKTSLYCLIATAALLTGPSAKSAVLFYDDFSGSNTVDLNGTTPDTTQGSITWSAFSGFKADGSTSGVGVAFLNIGSLINSNKGNADAIYTLETTFNVPNTNNGDWLGVGFVDDLNASTLNTIFSNTNNEGMNWLLRRENGAINTYTFQTNDSVTLSPAIAKGSLDVRMTYDLTDWNNTNNWGSVSIDAKLTSSSTFQSVRTIELTSSTTSSDLQGFGFSINNADTSTIDYVRLSQIPEPSAALLVAIGTLFLLRRRR